ncbi:MAG TPA: hypothetical protein ENF37_07310 [Beggiatoa sp.]|nr:hypothetical protein [Beggiatoa sp.]
MTFVLQTQILCDYIFQARYTAICAMQIPQCIKKVHEARHNELPVRQLCNRTAKKRASRFSL